MNRKFLFLLSSGFIFVSLCSGLSAQEIEIHPYAGGILAPSDLGSSPFGLKEQGIYGVKGEFSLTRNLEIGGNFGYLNHFEFRNTDPKSRGYLWEGTAAYNFNLENVKPFLSFGLGGITVQNDEVHTAPNLAPILEDESKFLTFSYGGGVKLPRLWGPVGIRGDVRGRTVPDLLGASTTWLEATGGIVLSF